MTTLAFDVYGTLINTQGVNQKLAEIMGDNATAFSDLWRAKQLEYSFRRGLMQQYQPFSVCTRDALDYACLQFGLALSTEQKQHLLQAYKTLPAFDDVIPALSLLKASGIRLFAFSNGTKEAVELLLKTAGIDGFFEAVVSCDEISSFKPNPAVYQHFLARSQSIASQAWLISSNPFDVLGAMSAGMQSAWIQRSPQAIFDPWGVQPTLTACDLVALAKQLIK